MMQKIEPKVTATVGAITLVISSSLILWVLGAFNDISRRPLLEAEQFVIRPDCDTPGKFQIQLELYGLNENTLQVIFHRDGSIAEECRKLTVMSTQWVRVERALSLEWLEGSRSIDGYRESGGKTVHTTSRRDLTADENEPAAMIKVDLKQVESDANAVLLRLDLPDITRKIDFSRGRARASFFIEGARSGSSSVKFFAIVHQDLRQSRIQGVNTDPTTPNVFEYQSSRHEIAGASSASNLVFFDAEFDSIRRDKLRDILLVALSALFGVGVSTLFESFLLTEVLRRMSSMFADRHD